MKTISFMLKLVVAGVAKNKALGWYVGFVERDNDVFYFALNMDGTSFNAI